MYVLSKLYPMILPTNMSAVTKIGKEAKKG